MYKLKRVSQTVWISSLAILLTACTSTDRKASLFGENLPTLKAVYQQQLGKDFIDRSKSARPIQDKQGDLQGDSLITYRQLRQRFPRFPNPELLLYVYPHLTPAGTPVPGYYTVFSFYREEQYALPSESVIAPSNDIDL